MRRSPAILIAIPTLYSYAESPIGELLLCGDGERLSRLSTLAGSAPPAGARRADARFAQVRAQLAEYFAGERREFDVQLSLEGLPPFHRRVWQALLKIPYGATITYGELAVRVGNAAGARAVGGASARNPVAIVIPCHRVVGADGRLTGYAGGLTQKQHLLRHEAAVRARHPGATDPGG